MIITHFCLFCALVLWKPENPYTNFELLKSDEETWDSDENPELWQDVAQFVIVDSVLPLSIAKGTIPQD